MRDPDLHAAVVGSGAIAPYDTHIAISTTAWISARVPFKRTDILHQIATVPGIDPAHPIVVNNQETGGAALHWLREQIVAPDDGLMGGGSGIGAEGAAAEGLAPSFDDLVRLAGQAPPGCEGLLFMPWLNGERSPAEDKTVRAGWLNLSLRTDRAMLVRSVLEGVAYNARWLFDAYEKFLRRPVPKVRLLGGGAQSDLWCQIYADVFGRPVEQVADPAQRATPRRRPVGAHLPRRAHARRCAGAGARPGAIRADVRGSGLRAELRGVPQAVRQPQGHVSPAQSGAVTGRPAHVASRAGRLQGVVLPESSITFTGTLPGTSSRMAALSCRWRRVPGPMTLTTISSSETRDRVDVPRGAAATQSSVATSAWSSARRAACARTQPRAGPAGRRRGRRWRSWRGGRRGRRDPAPRACSRRP